MITKLTVLLAACVHMLCLRPAAAAASAIHHVFVIAMENTDATQIYGNRQRAPYINQAILPKYAHSTNFRDPLPNAPSEPHYIWMEAGTHVFPDHSFHTNDDPSAANSTASTAHLVTQIAHSGTVSWMTYQEDITAKTGRCPLISSFPYAAKHNPFVFFQDVSGNPPSPENAYCHQHTKPYAAFAADLAANQMAQYVFITPNLCHDMHGDAQCPKGHRVTAGDQWLSAELPRLIEWVHQHAGVIFIVWDEGHSTTTLPFLAVGPGVKGNYASSVEYNHGSLIRSIEEIFQLPILPAVSQNNSLADLFRAGFFP